jgi:hypothetical protein
MGGSSLVQREPSCDKTQTELDQNNLIQRVADGAPEPPFSFDGKGSAPHTLTS